MKVYESYNISSISDLGALNFNVNFSVPLDGYLLQYYGNKTINIQISEEKDFLNFKILEPCPDYVTIIFFNKNF